MVKGRKGLNVTKQLDILQSPIRKYPTEKRSEMYFRLARGSRSVRNSWHDTARDNSRM